MDDQNSVSDNEEVKKLDNIVQILSREKEDHLRSIKELMQSSSEAQEEIDVLLHEIDRLEAEVTSSQSKLLAREIGLEAAETEVRRLKSLITSQNEEFSEKEKATFIEHTSVQNLLLAKTNEILVLKKDLETTKSKLRDLETEKIRLNDEKVLAINDLEAMLSSVQKQLADRESCLVDQIAFEAINESVIKQSAELDAARDYSVLMAEKYDEDCKLMSSQLKEQQINLSETLADLTNTRASVSALESKMEAYACDLADVVNGIMASARALNVHTSMYDNGRKGNEEFSFPSALELLRQYVSNIFSSLCAFNLEIASKKDEIAMIHQNIISKENQISIILEANIKQSQQISSMEDIIRIRENEVAKAIAAQDLECLHHQNDIASFLQEKGSLSGQITRFSSDLEGLQHLLAARDREILSLGSRLRSCEDENLILNSKLENSNLERKLCASAYEEKYSQMGTVIVDQERQLTEQGRALKRMSKLESELLRVQEEHSVSINEYQEKVALLHKDLSELREKNISLTKAAEQCDMKHHVNQLTKELSEKDDCIRVANERLSLAEEKVSSLTTDISDLGYKYDKRLNVIQAKSESASKTISLLEDRIILLKREKTSLTAELDKTINEFQSLNDRIQFLEKENTSLKQNSSYMSEKNANDEMKYATVKSDIPHYDMAHYSALSDEMDDFLSRLTTVSSTTCNYNDQDESMDESLFLPNDVALPSSVPNENNNPRNDQGMETPLKKEYGMKRQPLSDLKQSLATPITSHKKDANVSSKKKIKSGNKHRSNWMIYDNSKIFDH